MFSKNFPFSLICVASIGAVSPSLADTNADKIFADYENRYGEAEAKGYLPNSDANFLVFCRTGGPSLVLFRTGGAQPLFYEQDDYCANDVDEIDYNQDGEFEIRYVTVGTGSGFVGMAETIFNWPGGADAPIKGFRYERLNASSPGDRFFYEADGKEEIAFFNTVKKNQMLVGQNCQEINFCPEWPEGQPCREAMRCDIAQDWEQQLIGTLPAALIGDAKWEAFLEEQIRAGYVIKGTEIPTRLEELQLSDLSDNDTGKRAPKMTKEQSEKLDAWLQ